MRVRAGVVLAAIPLLLGAWTLSDNGVVPKQSPWNPRGRAVVKTPDGASHVIRSSFCSFGPTLVRLRFGGKLFRTDAPYMHLVATRREGQPAVFEVFDGVLTLPPNEAAVTAGTARVHGYRRGTFALLRDRDDVGTGKARYTGTWYCG
jgi:hypothetical protein